MSIAGIPGQTAVVWVTRNAGVYHSKKISLRNKHTIFTSGYAMSCLFNLRSLFIIRDADVSLLLCKCYE